MKNKITLAQILTEAKKVDANGFAKYLDENKINWTMHDCCIPNYNDDYFNITLDDFEDYFVSFFAGQYEE
jgi:tRNA(Ile)-lysidine synthase TilS/MesJ